MLELRPTCENCQRPLPPESTLARICSFECTFCADCVEGVLGGICPNCGGNFVARPIRPRRDWKSNNCLARFPAMEQQTHKAVDTDQHEALVSKLVNTPPEAR